MADQPGVIVVTGIMAAGKSTVAQALAERLPASVHLRGDVFRRMIVNGRVEISEDLEAAAAEQLRLRYDLAVAAAARYVAAGFTVVYQDVILGPVLGDIVAELAAVADVHVVVLAPSVAEVARREAGRAKTGYGAWTPEALDAGLRDETPRVGLWVDSSDLTVDETVETILARLEEARVSKVSGGPVGVEE
ncbi:AAA family ATPase [Aeromicrobium sp. NPDC092404]|uniref:AAA family ATPase n=1 Tax=Aeromicrobium sp. NPDC092404 TaxID=3154976 RepID=UPI0034470A71